MKLNVNIEDKDVREAIETIATEFEGLEDMNIQLNDEIEALQGEVSRLEDELETSKEYIKELEEALAHATLTGITVDLDS